jgi:hypothetical protein
MTSKLETILTRLDLRELLALFAEHEIDDALLGELTDEDLQRLGVEKLGPRKRLLLAFREEGAAPSVASAPVRAQLTPANVDATTREAPFLNELGLPFVPVPGHRTLFCIWQVRVRDFRVYCADAGKEFPPGDFEQTPDHPVVGVTWNEAQAFCQWLTKREREGRRIGDDFVYRLPEDREWSSAVGLFAEPWRTPAERSGKAKGYPWGTEFPPPRGAGNYHPSLAVDDFRETSPVGSFAPNALGLYDLGGNVWEWCQDEYDAESGRRVLRGASCFNDDEEYLMSSFRDKNPADHRRNNNGFRLALGRVPAKDAWF